MKDAQIFYDQAVPVDVVAVIVAYNSAHVIEGLLDSIPDALGGLIADVVVVDNGSADGTLDLLRSRDDCRVISSTNTGYAGGINVGVGVADDGPAILVLNPDVRLHSDAIAHMVKALRRSSIGIVAPQVRSPSGSLCFSLRRAPTILRTVGLTRTHRPLFAEYMNRPGEYAERRTVDWALGAVLLISRECYAALGGWDESYFLYSEETDFCLRARDRGFLTAYEPAALATHIGAQSGQGPNEHVMQTVNRIRLYRRRHSEAASWVYLGLTALREMMWIKRGGHRNRAAFVALFRPTRRPAALGCSAQIMPR